MSDLGMTPEQMVDWYNFRGEIIKELVETNGVLREENKRIKAAFRVNMLRAFPNMSHEEIDAEIEAAIRENEYWNMESITRNVRENNDD